MYMIMVTTAARHLASTWVCVGGRSSMWRGCGAQPRDDFVNLMMFTFIITLGEIM